MHSRPARVVADRDAPGDGLRLRRLGRRSHVDACALQAEAARSVAAGGSDQLLIVEHPPVVTLGRGATPDQLRGTAAELARAGIALVTTDRGGGATYHGPGQLVGYPIVALKRRRLSIRSFLGALESALIRTIRDQGVGAFVRPGLTGVWTERGKVAAIGIAVRQGITRHGFALNVDADLRPFSRIVPCGLREPVTSMAEHGWRGYRADLVAGLVAELAASFESATTAIHPGPHPRRPVPGPGSVERIDA